MHAYHLAAIFRHFGFASRLAVCCLLIHTIAGPAPAYDLQADFTASPTSGDIPLNVQFTDASSGVPTGWAWYFGDERLDGEWTRMTDAADWGVREDPGCVVLSDGSIIMAGGLPAAGFTASVWRSVDCGASWNAQTADTGWGARWNTAGSMVVLSDDAIVVTGGAYNQAPNYHNDVWRSEDQGASWTRITDAPGWAGRYMHASVVLRDDSIMLMGGQISQFTNDVWRSRDRGATWECVNADAPWAARRSPACVALPDDTMVLMGGEAAGAQLMNDVWRSTDNGTNWVRVAENAPWAPRRSFFSVALPDGTIVLMGGIAYDGSGYVRTNDIWLSRDDGATWVEETSAAEWGEREMFAGGLLPDGNIFILGGRDNSLARMGDVWRLSTAGSTIQNPEHVYTGGGSYTVALQVFNDDDCANTQKTAYVTVDVPPPDFSADITIGVPPLDVQFVDATAGAPDSWGWFFGGSALTGAWGQVIHPAPWTARDKFDGVVLPDGDIVIAGGYINSPPYAIRDVWRSADGGASWTEMTSTAAWSARTGHACVALPDGGILLMGGNDGSVKNDVWYSSDKGATWVQQTGAAPWPARIAFAAVVLTDGSVVIMGGHTTAGEGGHLQDVWRSVDNGATWQELTAEAGWPARSSHSAVALADDSIVLTGGEFPESPLYLNDVWRSTDQGATWTRVTDDAEWLGRWAHRSVLLPDDSIVLMGGNHGQFTNDVWRSVDGGATWQAMPPAAWWTSRMQFFGGALPDGRILVIGGNGSGMKNDVWSLATVDSAVQHPACLYTEIGNYNVTLTVSRDGEFSVTRKESYINVVPPVPEMRVLGVDGGVVESGAAASAARGTDFGERVWGDLLTRTLSITNAGYATLNLTGVTVAGTGASAFSVQGVPASILEGAVHEFSVSFNPPGGGAFDAVLEIGNDSPVTPYSVHLKGTGGRKNQVIEFAAIPQQTVGDMVTLSATTSSGLPVSFNLVSGPAAFSGAATLVCNAAGTVVVAASQPGNTDWHPAPNVTNSFNVSPLELPAAPTGVNASDGAYTYKVLVSWNAVDGAGSYEVFRHTRNDSGAAARIATTTATTYADTSASKDLTYYYWVKAVNRAGAGAFSEGACGHLGVVGPRIAVNGLVGDNVRLTAGTPLRITVAMMNVPAAYLGVEVDWWVAAYAHRDGLWYYLDHTMAWIPFDGLPANIRPAYQGPLAELPAVAVADGLRLGPGIYNIWFVVDYPMDGVLRMDEGDYLMSHVTLVIE